MSTITARRFSRRRVVAIVAVVAALGLMLDAGSAACDPWKGLAGPPPAPAPHAPVK